MSMEYLDNYISNYFNRLKFFDNKYFSKIQNCE